MSHSDRHCLREQFFGPQLKAAHSVILFCSCLIPPAITQTVVHRGLSSDSNSSWFYLAPLLLHLHRDGQVSSPWLKGTSKCLGCLMRWGVVCMCLCVCVCGGDYLVAAQPLPSLVLPMDDSRHSPSEDPPLLHFPHCPSSCCHAVFSLLSPGPGLSGFSSGRGKQTTSFMHPRIFLLLPM